MYLAEQYGAIQIVTTREAVVGRPGGEVELKTDAIAHEVEPESKTVAPHRQRGDLCRETLLRR